MRWQLGAPLLLLLLLGLVALTTSRLSTPPLFTLDGHPLKPDHFGPELVQIGDEVVRLRSSQQRYDFTNKAGSLSLEGRCVAWKNEPPAGADPAEAWGVSLSRPPRAPISPETLVTIHAGSGQAWTLPPGLRALRLLPVSSPEPWLIGQTSLTHLTVQCPELDLALLDTCPRLTTLSIRAKRVTNLDHLNRLKQLTHLHISSPTLTSCPDLSACPNLEELAMDFSAVSDLRPLASLPRLQRVSAVFCPVRYLPESVKWSSLDLLESQVDLGLLQAFRASSPDCQVWGRNEDPLRAALQGADRLTIGGSQAGKPVYETNDAGEIASFIETLELAPNDGFAEIAEGYLADELSMVISGITMRRDMAALNGCLCGGGAPLFHFYRRGELLAVLGNVHGRSISWTDPWLGDGRLSDAGRERYLDWLTRHGLNGPRQEYERSARQERERRQPR